MIRTLCVLIVCAAGAVVLAHSNQEATVSATARPFHGNNPDSLAIAVLFGVEIAILIDSDFSRGPCGSPSDPSEWMNDCMGDPWVGGGQNETCLDTCLRNCDTMDEACGWNYSDFATCTDLCWDAYDG